MDLMDPYQALRFREYRSFLAGSVALTMGTQIQTLVMGWQVYHITRDPFSLGLIGLSEAAPFLALTLIGGYAADRMDRRRLSLLALAALLLGAVLLLSLNLGAAPRLVWPFYVIQALAGAGRAFHRPASQALGTELVPMEAYQNAAAWRGSSMQLAQVLGPALGGLILGYSSAVMAYLVEGLLMAGAVVAMLMVAPRPRALKQTQLLKGLSEGVVFVFKDPLLLGSMSLDLFAVLFGGAVALLPVFAADILHVGPQGFGLLRTAPAVGSVFMGLWLAHHPPRMRAGLVLLMCVAVFGLCWIGFALSWSFWLSMALLVLSGGMDNVSVVLRNTLLQSRTPMEMMGRVQAVGGFFIGSSNELGGFESGVAAKLLGLIPSVVFGGCMTLGVVGAISWKVPELRKLKKLLG
ncbi:MAG: MFS transporter [Holophaga sp.]|nr:MFS transporter [Holophaga sp.]